MEDSNGDVLEEDQNDDVKEVAAIKRGLKGCSERWIRLHLIKIAIRSFLVGCAGHFNEFICQKFTYYFLS